MKEESPEEEDDEEEGGDDDNEEDEDDEEDEDGASTTSRKKGQKIAHSGDGEAKWTTLYHTGPRFPPAYEPLPKAVKMKYDGEYC